MYISADNLLVFKPFDSTVSPLDHFISTLGSASLDMLSLGGKLSLPLPSRPLSIMWWLVTGSDFIGGDCMVTGSDVIGGDCIVSGSDFIGGDCMVTGSDFIGGDWWQGVTL